MLFGALPLPTMTSTFFSPVVWKRFTEELSLRTEPRSRAARETRRAGLAYRTTQRAAQETRTGVEGETTQGRPTELLTKARRPREARNPHTRRRSDDPASPSRAAHKAATPEEGTKAHFFFPAFVHSLCWVSASRAVPKFTKCPKPIGSGLFNSFRGKSISLSSML